MADCYVVFPSSDGRGRRNGLTEKQAIEMAGGCVGAIAYSGHDDKICTGTEESMRKIALKKQRLNIQC